MLNNLMNEAEDIFFARHSSKVDEATMQEIQNDLLRFMTKVERAELKDGIKKALIKVASK